MAPVMKLDADTAVMQSDRQKSEFAGFKRIFVANRGEIAVRIIRACRALGIESVVGFSEADRESLGVRLADRAVCIGPASAAASYLRGETLVTAALGTGCDALHPGYGFLSERAKFQRLCAEAGVVFIGPSADAIERMGDKINAIAAAKAAGVAVVPGRERIASAAELRETVLEIGFPCLLKASAGGGGRGMRLIANEGDIESSFVSARAEAIAAFGDGTLYLEKYIQNARHVEVQVIGDHHGNICHLYERDCTVQRRHQKIVEEAPCPVLSPELRKQMAESALKLARSVGYTNAGTVEFIFDAESGEFYFLEMNTRVQVEHPVTEMITGIDIVAEQIRIAAGYSLSFDQVQVRISGCSIECRINAEDALRGFVPSPGKLTGWQPPSDDRARLDTHCYEGFVVSPYYDSMIAKVIVWDETRAAAIDRLQHYLSRFRIEGIVTTADFVGRLVGHPDFRSAKVTTKWLEERFLPDLESAAAGAT